MDRKIEAMIYGKEDIRKMGEDVDRRKEERSARSFYATTVNEKMEARHPNGKDITTAPKWEGRSNVALD